MQKKNKTKKSPQKTKNSTNEKNNFIVVRNRKDYGFEQQRREGEGRKNKFCNNYNNSIK